MARHDAERRKLATEPEREGNRVAHAKLTGHHLVTAETILSHPASHNVGSNGRFTVTLGDETQVFDRPRGKDLDTQQIVDLRKMLKTAGFSLENIHE
jgi:hypothetical protein